LQALQQSLLLLLHQILLLQLRLNLSLQIPVMHILRGGLGPLGCRVLRVGGGEHANKPDEPDYPHHCSYGRPKDQYT
jgi:hypothetical protein